MPTAEELSLKAREMKRKRDLLVTRIKMNRENKSPITIPEPINLKLREIADRQGWSVRDLASALIEHALDDMGRVL